MFLWQTACQAFWSENKRSIKNLHINAIWNSEAFSDSVNSHCSISVWKCRIILHQTSFLLLLIESFPAQSQKLSVWFVIGWWNITFANMYTAAFKNNTHISFKTGFVGHAHKLNWLLWIQCNSPRMLKLFLLYFSTSCMKHELTVLHST